MKDTVHKCVIGVLGPATGYAVSISTMETWLRILSLVIGSAVGVASLISIGFSIRRKYNNWRNETKKPIAEKEEQTTTV